MKKLNLSIVISFLIFGGPTFAALSPESGVVMLPMNCSELLPDPAPYLTFMEAVARSSVTKDRAFAKRILRILALRDRFAESPDRGKDQNPIDVLVRRTLCFYREQKVPTAPVSFDDAGVVAFLKLSINELESKVTSSLFDIEIERQQRKAYERKLRANQGLVEKLQIEADDEADRTFDKLATAAKKKLRTE